MDRSTFLRTFPQLVNDYQPAPDVLKKIGNLSLLIIIGPSGVGKTTLLQNVDIPFVPSDMTRPSRPDEQDGRDNYFRSDYDQIISEVKNGRFVQVAISSGGDFYATRESSYPESGAAALPVVADAVPTVRNLGFKETLSVFIVPPSFEEWMSRMKTHELSEEQLSKRLAEAERSLEFALGDKDMHFVLSDTIASATAQAKAILAGNPDAGIGKAARNKAAELLERLRADGRLV